MRRIRWNVWLPVAQILLAIGLALMGRGQTQHETRRWFQTWDYVAPAEIILHSLNYPAAVATGLTARHHSFQIGLEYSTGTFLLYLAYIALLWFLVGWLVGKSRGSTIDHPVPTWLSLAGILSASLLLLRAFAMLKGPYGLLLVMAGFLWSAIFLVAFSTMLAYRLRART